MKFSTMKMKSKKLICKKGNLNVMRIPNNYQWVVAEESEFQH